ncbi:hypothetical protein [Arthrobacter sp. NEB 688]|uniref:LysM peptidoglycan-binding domain-containing protein n=1 Tax=Arthrobacter sp. NEB 688 TaxID=904039 RepID=UPI00256FBA43|nr:hypothetical protein [Arthrobacter sp. NEB 688]
MLGTAVAAATTGALGVLALRTARAASAGVPVTADDALVAALAALAAVVLGWLVLAMVLEALAGVPGVVGRHAALLSARLAPRAARRLAALVLGAGVVTGGGLGTASADPLPGAMARPTVTPAVHGTAATDTGLPDPGWGPGGVVAPDPGWTPDAPVVRRQPDVSVVSGRVTGADRDTVVVHRGDSLWTLAARHLGSGATDAEIARAWPRWYAANRALIGADPDLLLPGQVLRAPTVDAS